MDKKVVTHWNAINSGAYTAPGIAITPAMIAMIAATAYQLRPVQIFERNRNTEHVNARAMFFFFVRNLLRMKYHRIAILCELDHTTVIYHIRRIRENYQTEPAIHDKLIEVAKKLGVMENTVNDWLNSYEEYD